MARMYGVSAAAAQGPCARRLRVDGGVVAAMAVRRPRARGRGFPGGVSGTRPEARTWHAPRVPSTVSVSAKSAETTSELAASAPAHVPCVVASALGRLSAAKSGAVCLAMGEKWPSGSPDSLEPRRQRSQAKPCGVASVCRRLPLPASACLCLLLRRDSCAAERNLDRGRINRQTSEGGTARERERGARPNSTAWSSTSNVQHTLPLVLASSRLLSNPDLFAPNLLHAEPPPTATTRGTHFVQHAAGYPTGRPNDKKRAFASTDGAAVHTQYASPTTSYGDSSTDTQYRQILTQILIQMLLSTDTPRASVADSFPSTRLPYPCVCLASCRRGREECCIYGSNVCATTIQGQSYTIWPGLFPHGLVAWVQPPGYNLLSPAHPKPRCLNSAASAHPFKVDDTWTHLHIYMCPQLSLLSPIIPTHTVAAGTYHKPPLNASSDIIRPPPAAPFAHGQT